MSKEHVSGSCTLLPAPLQVEPVDSEPLPSCRDIRLDSHEPRLNAIIDEATEGSELSEEDFYISGHQHYCVRHPRGLNLDQDRIRWIFRLPADCDILH